MTTQDTLSGTLFAGRYRIARKLGGGVKGPATLIELARLAVGLAEPGVNKFEGGRDFARAPQVFWPHGGGWLPLLDLGLAAAPFLAESPSDRRRWLGSKLGNDTMPSTSPGQSRKLTALRICRRFLPKPPRPSPCRGTSSIVMPGRSPGASPTRVQRAASSRQSADGRHPGLRGGRPHGLVAANAPLSRRRGPRRLAGPCALRADAQAGSWSV